MEKYFMAAMGGAEGLGNKSIATLVKFFGSAKDAWSAEIFDLLKSGVRDKPLAAFIEFRIRHPGAPEKLLSYCERHRINLCSIFDEDYPPPLRQIDSPPMFFYYRGQLQPHAPRVAIVGTRNNTPYGRNVALEFGEKFAAAGVTVVSGAARGIDTFAHSGALKRGRTVAVLGCGIDCKFSPEREKFFAQIAECGVVLSEFPPQMPPTPGTFPTRNRIIAGLSRGVVVVEAGARSGALLTATYAGNYGRDVFAVPGQIYSDKSKGCNKLIRDCATLIESADDVLNEYHIAAPENFSAKEFVPPEVEPKIKPPEKKSGRREKILPDGDAAKVLEIIPPDKFITEDEILMQLEEINPNDLPRIMIELEIKGCVEEDAGRYKRKAGG